MRPAACAFAARSHEHAPGKVQELVDFAVEVLGVGFDSISHAFRLGAALALADASHIEDLHSATCRSCLCSALAANTDRFAYGCARFADAPAHLARIR